MGTAPPAPPEVDATVAAKVVKEAAALGLATDEDPMTTPLRTKSIIGKKSVSERRDSPDSEWATANGADCPYSILGLQNVPFSKVVSLKVPGNRCRPKCHRILAVAHSPRFLHQQHPWRHSLRRRCSQVISLPAYQPSFNLQDLHEALDLVRQMDPPGVACRDLRDCLLYQLRYHQQQLCYAQERKRRSCWTSACRRGCHRGSASARSAEQAVQRNCSRHRPSAGAVQEALEYIRTLDPRPGLRYNVVQPRLIEPDVAFIKHGDEWIVMMNEDDVPVFV